MPAEFEDLSRRLSDLDSDLARVQMAGPAAARRRGRQRTRNRAAGVALGTAAAIVIGIGALNAMPQTTSTPEPIDTPSEEPAPEPEPTPNETSTPDPSPSTEESEPGPLADLLLEPADLAALGSPWELDWTERPRQAAMECSPAGPDDVDTAGITFEAGRSAEQVGDFLALANEDIYALASQAEAADALTALRNELGQCATDRDDVELTRTWEYDGIGDAAFQSELFREELGQRIAVNVGAARIGSTLILTVNNFYLEGEFDGQSNMLAAAVSEVCGGDCVDEITQRQTYPESAQADDQLLLDQEVNPVGTYTDFARSPTHTDPDRYEYFCLPDLVFEDAAGQPSSEPVQVGGEAPTIYQAQWYGPSEAGFHETVMQFPDTQSATAFVADHETLPEQCGEVVETHEQVVNQPTSVQVSGADDALVWTIDERVLPSDPGSEPSFHGVGMARSGSVVVVIGFGASGDPTSGTDGTWADYATQTLALALERAQG